MWDLIMKPGVLWDEMWTEYQMVMAWILWG